MPTHKIIKRKTQNLVNKSPKKKNPSSEGHVTRCRKNPLSTDARFSFDVFVARSSICGNEIRENVWGVLGKWCLGCDGGSVRLHCSCRLKIHCSVWSHQGNYDFISCDRISNTRCSGAWWLQAVRMLLWNVSLVFISTAGNTWTWTIKTIWYTVRLHKWQCVKQNKNLDSWTRYALTISKGINSKDLCTTGGPYGSAYFESAWTVIFNKYAKIYSSQVIYKHLCLFCSLRC